MTQLSADIKIKFFRLICGEEPVCKFEQWVYARDDLEAILGKEDYFNLVSLDFSKPGNKYELIKLIERHIDRGEYETWKLRKLLQRFLKGQGDLSRMLIEFYALYCRGFYFLDALGLEYGLAIKIPPRHYSAEYWDELTDKERNALLHSILPDVMDEAQRVLDWLDGERIVITNEQDELGHFLYVDHRTEEEK